MSKVLLILPIYNEEKDLRSSVEKLVDYCRRSSVNKYDWEILIADNASSDRSCEIAQVLIKKYKQVRYYHLDQKGRGRALKEVWINQVYDISLYMDIDLSTDLNHLMPCLDALSKGGADLAIGSRFTRGSKVIGRPLIRRICSAGYIRMVRLISRSKLSDFQCGFKGITKKAAEQILPMIKDGRWFFDTELLLMAEKRGYKIHQEPVLWTDDLDSTVRIFETAKEDIKGLYRVVWKERLG